MLSVVAQSKHPGTQCRITYNAPLVMLSVVAQSKHPGTQHRITYNTASNPLKITPKKVMPNKNPKSCRMKSQNHAECVCKFTKKVI